jgi:hypothetical protein
MLLALMAFACSHDLAATSSYNIRHYLSPATTASTATCHQQRQHPLQLVTSNDSIHCNLSPATTAFTATCHQQRQHPLQLVTSNDSNCCILSPATTASTASCHQQRQRQKRGRGEVLVLPFLPSLLVARQKKIPSTLVASQHTTPCRLGCLHKPSTQLISRSGVPNNTGGVLKQTAHAHIPSMSVTPSYRHNTYDLPVQISTAKADV